MKCTHACEMYTSTHAVFISVLDIECHMSVCLPCRTMKTKRHPGNLLLCPCSVLQTSSRWSHLIPLPSDCIGKTANMGVSKAVEVTACMSLVKSRDISQTLNTLWSSQLTYQTKFLIYTKKNQAVKCSCSLVCHPKIRNVMFLV